MAEPRPRLAVQPGNPAKTISLQRPDHELPDGRYLIAYCAPRESPRPADTDRLVVGAPLRTGTRGDA